MSPPDNERPSIEELRDRLKSFDAEGDYFAATLSADEAGRWGMTFLDHFVGWPDGGGPEDGVELRAPTLVRPTEMTQLWESLSQPWIAVDSAEELWIFMRIGGNGLIRADVATERLPERLLAPREAFKPGLIGFEQYDENSAGPLNVHRPTPKQRTRVMKRDGYRCQLCGEQPALNEHIVLTVHHITPFGSGGVTHDENLITLCHTCHRGLDPHEDLSLYLVPGGQVDRALASDDSESHRLAVERYRDLVRRVHRHDENGAEGT